MEGSSFKGIVMFYKGFEFENNCWYVISDRSGTSEKYHCIIDDGDTLLSLEGRDVYLNVDCIVFDTCAEVRKL